MKVRTSLHKPIPGNIIFVFFLALLLNTPAHAQSVNLDSLLTTEEITWLNNNRPGIRYATNPAWPPAAWLDHNVPKGFIADYVAAF